MPFLSKSQRRKFYALKAEGKMDQKTIDEWESETPKKLPERIMKKKAFWENFEKVAIKKSTALSALKKVRAAGASEKKELSLVNHIFNRDCGEAGSKVKWTKE